jgi:hypothetical protein
MIGVRCDYCGEMLFDDDAIQFTELVVKAHPAAPYVSVNGVTPASAEEWERKTFRVHWPRCFLQMHAEENPDFVREMKKVIDDTR